MDTIFASFSFPLAFAQYSPGPDTRADWSFSCHHLQQGNLRYGSKLELHRVNEYLV